jgi:hypothetical protein
MSDGHTDPVTSAASAVMAALQPLAPEERQRVIDASAALFGLSSPRRPMGGASDTSTPEESDEPETPGGSAPKEKRQSIVEFLNTKSPATNSQRLACFAFYREHVEKKGQYFSSADLKPYFQSAKLPKPGNFNRDFRDAVSASWIHEDNASSYLTQAGENAVKAGFGGKGRPRGPAVAKKKKSSGRKPA